MAIKLLLGGSPCTYWSVAQSTDKRETTAEGLGWELFKNYLVAKEKFQPDYFLYENNKSAAPAIKEQISETLDVSLMDINSALVSAQNRQRFYAFNWEVPQPEERGLVVEDILCDEASELEQSYPLVATSKPKATPATQIKIGTIGNKSQSNLVYSSFGKSSTLMANGGGQGAKTGLYAVPIRIGVIGKGTQGERVYSTNGKSVALMASGGAKAGLYAVPQSEETSKAVTIVSEGKTVIDGELCDISLPDGAYLIRKLSPLECERLQTMPDHYTAGVSNTQRYKGLGNGWTAEVIIHILNGILRDVPRDEELIVLSMYDGIGTGRYCLDKMGFTNVTYHAYEIDKYAMQISEKNYPDIIQHGDAFAVREDDWGGE